MKLVSEEITDLKAEFEGGKSLSLDWYGLLRRAADTMLGQIHPDTLRRRVPIYGGVAKGIEAYFAPTDILVPGDLYPLAGERKFTFEPPAQFYRNTRRPVFTLDYINKIRFLIARHKQDKAVLELNSMDTTTNLATTTSGLTLDTFNYLSGTGAIRATFDSSGLYIQDTLDTAQDITEYLQGIAVVPVFWADGDIVSSVTLQLISSSGNYVSVTTTADSIGSNIVDGWNILRFALANRSTTGSPDTEAIAFWKIIVTMDSGESQEVVIDRITLQAAQAFDFEYVSNMCFIDGTTGAFKRVPVDGDYINLDRDAQSILHWEACRKTGKKSISGLNFSDELAREYEQYFTQHPSTAILQSYNIAPQIGIGIAPGFEPVIIEETIEEEATATVVNYADNEVVGGSINGSNDTFTLAHSPSPAKSLMLWLNGIYQVQDVDYTLSGSTITYTTAPAVELASATHVASYRY